MKGDELIDYARFGGKWKLFGTVKKMKIRKVKRLYCLTINVAICVSCLGKELTSCCDFMFE